MKLDGLLRRITSLIVSACDPEKIVLFGSYAKGMQNADSDMDILVIGNFQGSCFLLSQELQQLLHGYPIRIDLHVVTLQEVDAESTKPFGCLNSVLASGVVLYPPLGCIPVLGRTSLQWLAKAAEWYFCRAQQLYSATLRHS